MEKCFAKRKFQNLRKTNQKNYKLKFLNNIYMRARVDMCIQI